MEQYALISPEEEDPESSTTIPTGSTLQAIGSGSGEHLSR